MLIVASKARRTSTAAASDSGIAVNVIAAARRFARNNTTMRTTRQAAIAECGDNVVDCNLDEVRLAKILRSIVMPAGSSC